MLIFKSNAKLLTILTLILIAIHSLNTVFLSVIISNVITAAGIKSMDMFLKYLAIGILGFIFFMIIGVLMTKVKTVVVKKQNVYIKNKIIKHVVSSSKNHDDYSKDLSLMTNELKQLETNGIEGEFAIANLVFTFTFALIASYKYDAWIATAFLIGTVLAISLSAFFNNKIKRTSKKWTVDNALYTNRLKDYLSGIETVKTYQAEDIVTEKVTDEAYRMEESLKTMNFSVQSANQVLYIAVMILSFLIPLGLGVYKIIEYNLPYATFMAIVTLSNSLRTPSLHIMQLVNAYNTTKPIRIKYYKAKNSEYTNVGNKDEPELFEKIELKNIKVQFDDFILFENLNLTIDKNDKILIIGPSGIGKSTLLRVIQQSQAISSGTYLYNEKAVETDLAKQFSLIRQQPLMFNDTILYNITLGMKFSLEDISEAINLAELDELIEEKGLDYLVGEKGSNLSVGQLQRIEIARALIRKRPIILADEITSSLDANKADEIRKTLLDSPYTVIEVAHNFDETNKELYTQVWDLNEIEKG